MQYADVCTVYGGKGERICGFDPDVCVLMGLWYDGVVGVVWIVWCSVVLVVFDVECDSRCGGWVIALC